MSLKAFITKHFGGIPTSLKSLEWIIRVNPTSPNSFPTADEYRKKAPGSQPNPNLKFDLPIAKNRYPYPFKSIGMDDRLMNRYYERDSRRNYPQTVSFSREQLANLPLIGNGPDKGQEERVVLNFRYKYSTGSSGLDPTGSEANPQFSIRTVR